MRSRIPSWWRLPRAAAAVIAIVVAVYAVGWAGLAAGAHLAKPVTTGRSIPVGDVAPTTAPQAPSTTSTQPEQDLPATSPTITPGADQTVLRPGGAGPEVVELQTHLTERGYWLGSADGTYGDLTMQAVTAFQKAEGLQTDGVAGRATLERLTGATRPAARTQHGDAIEIDLDRQLLFVVRDGHVEWVLDTSTGATATPTSPGSFDVEREVDGVRRAPLGTLYRPKYFNAGIAIHGYPSVPAFPASHGCARVSRPAMDLLWSTDAASIGSAVWVYE